MLTGGETKVNFGNGYLEDACSVASGCDYWFDASNEASFFSDSGCTTPWTPPYPTNYARCWNNLRGGASITRGAGYTGTYVSNVQNGMGAYYIRPSGGAQGVESASLSITPLTTQTWFLVAQIDSVPAAERYIFGNAMSGPLNHTGVSIDNTLAFNAYYGAATPISSGTSAVAVGETFLITLIAHGASYELYLNGSYVNSSPIGSPTGANPMGIAALNYGTVVNGADMYMFEMVV